MLDLSNVRMTPASERDAEHGLLGYITFRVGPVLVDGMTLRRTDRGEFTLSLSALWSRLKSSMSWSASSRRPSRT